LQGRVARPAPCIAAALAVAALENVGPPRRDEPAEHEGDAPALDDARQRRQPANRQREQRRMGPDYPVEIPRDDLRLIASRLTTKQWNRVTIALSNIANLDRLMRQRIARRGSVNLPPHIIEAVSGDLDDNCRAQGALQDLAKFDGVACPVLSALP